MKKLLTLLVLVAGLMTARADIVTGTVATNATFTVLTNAVVVNSIQLSATTSGGFSLQMYDVNVPSTTYTNVAYTNTTSYSSNLVTTFVGATGVTNNYTNTVIITDRITTPASTNTAYQVIGAWAVNANESLLIPGPFVLTKGLTFKTVSPLTNGNYIINYRSP